MARQVIPWVVALACQACTVGGDDIPVPPAPSVTAGTPVWPAPAKERVAELIRAAGLDDTGTGDKGPIAWIFHLDVYVEGVSVQVPPNLGIDFVSGVYSPVHTHLYGGYVHIESPVIGRYTLGQLFKLWDRPLAGATAYVNGQAAASAPGVALADRQEVAVVFGKPPASIPSAFPDPSASAKPVTP